MGLARKKKWEPSVTFSLALRFGMKYNYNSHILRQAEARSDPQYGNVEA